MDEKIEAELPQVSELGWCGSRKASLSLHTVILAQLCLNSKLAAFLHDFLQLAGGVVVKPTGLEDRLLGFECTQLM